MSEQHGEREVDRWTDPTADPLAGLPATVAALKASQWITDPHADLDDDSTVGEEQPSGWAFVEVGCGGDRPVVAFRIPTCDDGWGYVSADDAIAFGTALVRIAGAAQASVINGG